MTNSIAFWTDSTYMKLSNQRIFELAEEEKTHQSKDLNLARNINSDGVTRRMRKMHKCLCEAAVPLLQKTRQKPEEKEAVRPWPVH